MQKSFSMWTTKSLIRHGAVTDLSLWGAYMYISEGIFADVGAHLLLQEIDIPLSQRSLDILMQRLDINKDGHVDFRFVEAKIYRFTIKYWHKRLLTILVLELKQVFEHVVEFKSILDVCQTI